MGLFVSGHEVRMNGITKKLIVGASAFAIVIGLVFVNRFALISWAAKYGAIGYLARLKRQY